MHLEYWFDLDDFDWDWVRGKANEFAKQGWKDERNAMDI